MKKIIAVLTISLILLQSFISTIGTVSALDITPTPTEKAIESSKLKTNEKYDIKPFSSFNVVSNASDSAQLSSNLIPENIQKLRSIVSESQESASLKRKTILKDLVRNSFQANEKIIVSVERDLENSISLKLVNPKGEVFVVSNPKNTITEVTNFEISPPQSFVPGTYKMILTDSVGTKYEQDFTWGVLAINTNKSIYLPDEKAHLTMAVLNENGSMVCNAGVVLNIKKPNGEIDTLSTDSKTIKVHPDCVLKAFTTNPDYESYYQVGEAGKYQVELTAITENGKHTIQDQFEVRASVPFDVERKGPTRIYPPKEYEVELVIKANEDFAGKIEEIVPSSFSVDKVSKEFHLIQENIQQQDNDQILGASTSAMILQKPYEKDCQITLPFGNQYQSESLENNITSDFHLDGHDGIDIDMPEGTSILATHDGTVVVAGKHDYGNTVTIEHDWGKSYYGHLSDILVKEGETVKAGQLIAKSGNTGKSTGPHLHFGIKPKDSDQNNGYGGMVDPMIYLPDLQPKVLGAQTEYVLDKRVLSWEVELKGGETKILKYKFKAPNISPEFYLLGPLKFIKDQGVLSVERYDDEQSSTSEAKIETQNSQDTLVSTNLFQEARRWQIAVDADVTIDSAAILGDSRGMRNTVFTSTLVGYHFFIDDDSDLSYLKTADGGATWTGLTDIKSSETITGFDVWYDKWTPGDTGSLIHIWYVGTGADDVVYESLDTANSDTQSNEVIAFNGGSSVAGRGVFVSGAKMRGGNLYVAFDIDAGAEKGVRRSTDAGANWTIRYTTGTTDTIIEATVDQALLFPGNESDNQDLWILYHDASTDELTLKTHDDSANTTSESSVIVSLVENTTDGTGQYGFSGSIRHSDNHLLVVTESAYDNSGSDMQTWDINGAGSITQKTAISTNVDDQYYPQIYIDQSSGEIIVAYIGLRDGSQTLGTTNGVYYTTSTDGMANWSSGDSAYSATSSDWRNLWVPPMGPRFLAVWRDISSQALMTNYDNSIPNVAPSVVLNTPADASSDTDTTPTLDFTGTDADTDSIEYNVQVHTDNTFGVTVTKTDLTSGSGSSATSFNTASITPSANKLILLSVASRVSGGGNNTPSASGNGITWEVVQSVQEAGSWNRITILRSMGSAPTTGAITISFAGQTQVNAIWSVSEYGNVDTSGSNGAGAIVQNATNTGVAATTLSVTLGAFADTDNATYGAIVSEVAGAINNGTGFTEIHDANTTDNSLETEWRVDNDTSVDWSWGSGARVGGIAIEIDAGSPLLNKVSTSDSGFVNPDTGGDTHPFNSGENIQFTVQAGDALSTGTYYWRVKGTDPAGTNTYGSWATTRSFTITSSGPTMDQLMRHGNWFSSGVEQPYSL